MQSRSIFLIAFNTFEPTVLNCSDQFHRFCFRVILTNNTLETNLNPLATDSIATPNTLETA